MKKTVFILGILLSLSLAFSLITACDEETGPSDELIAAVGKAVGYLFMDASMNQIINPLGNGIVCVSYDRSQLTVNGGIHGFVVYTFTDCSYLGVNFSGTVRIDVNTDVGGNGTATFSGTVTFTGDLPVTPLEVTFNATVVTGNFPAGTLTMSGTITVNGSTYTVEELDLSF